MERSHASFVRDDRNVCSFPEVVELEHTLSEALMVVVLRLLIVCALLVFYLPVISGVALAIIDAAGWLPGTLTNWWKDVGGVIADGAGLPANYKANMFTLWGIAALLTVIGHTLLSLTRVRA
jgi:hypothetical protein